MALTIGTNGAVHLPIDKPFIDLKMITQFYHLVDKQYFTLGAINNGAVILQWLKESILQSNKTFEELLENAQCVSAGSNQSPFDSGNVGRDFIWIIKHHRNIDS